MRIAVDLLSLPDAGGTRTYALEVLPRLRKRLPDLRAIVREDSEPALRKLLDGVTLHVAPASTRNPYRRHLYQGGAVPDLMRAEKADVLWVPGGLTGTRKPPGATFRMVGMVQNMLPFEPEERSRFPLWGEARTRFWLWMLSRGMVRTLSAMDRILFISRHSQEVVSRRIGPKDHRIIPHGIGDAFRAPAGPADDAVLSRLGIRKPYLLYVSTFDPYKHQLSVLRAFETLRAGRDLRLVLSGLTGGNGSRGTYGREVQRAARALGESVICTGLLPQPDLPALCRRAEILLFASTCETCPNILLEYLAAGRPIVSSRKAPMPEFGGDGAVYVDALDPDAWTKELTRLLADAAAADALGARAKARSVSFSWDETAARTAEALTEW